LEETATLVDDRDRGPSTGGIARLWAVFALVALGGCGAEPPLAMVGEARHSNGLVVPYPEELEPGEGPDGFRFTDRRDLRRPRFVAIALTDAAPPDEAEPTSFGGPETRLLVEELGSGSGGMEYRLSAWRPVHEGWIAMLAEQQREGDAPNFATPWAMMEGARVER